jgi:phospholipid/cholesterol/gamma-HCH transport system substrate-binding protein
MDPSKFVDKESKRLASNSNIEEPPFLVPKRTFTTEFYVGLFSIVSLLAAGWLAVGLGGIELFSSNSYVLYAEFDNISGLQSGASVEIGGVPIGQVTDISLKDPEALITMKIQNSVKIQDDDIAAVRTKGIIGDRYIKISRGSSEQFIEPSGLMIETESVVDIEDIIGKLVHTFTSKEES